MSVFNGVFKVDLLLYISRKSKEKFFLKKVSFLFGVPIVAQWLTNPTRNHGVAGSVPGLAQWVKNLALL